MSRVLRREIDQLASRTTLRRVNLRAVERLLDNVSLVQLQRNEQLARALRGDAIRANEKCLQDRRVSLFIHVLEELMVAGKQLSAPDAHPRDARIRAVAGIAQHVPVSPLDLENDGRLLHAL